MVGSLSIRAKLALAAAASVACLLGAYAVIGISDRSQTRVAFVEDVTITARVIARNSNAAVAFSDSDGARDILAALEADPKISAAALHDIEGVLIASYGEVDQVSSMRMPPELGTPVVDDHHVTMAHAVELDGAVIGSVCVQGDLDAQPRLGWFWRFGSPIVVCACVALLLIFHRIRRSLIDPIEELAGIADRVSADEDFGLRARKFSEDELGRLADRFNEMLAQAELRDRNLVAARNEAVAATEAKSSFLANMSHEIRTPMTAILGYAEVLMDDGSDAGERARALDTIWRNGHHLLGIINNILDISKIEAGKLEIERLEFSPAAVLREVVGLMEVRARARALGLTVECDGPIPALIRSDPTRLKQILINLIGNALRFTEVGGVTVHVRHALSGGGRSLLEIDVVDTGIGMSDAVQARLFRPFAQADESMSRRFGGTGLGLSISLGLAELLGGGVSVRSAVGEGSTFRVRIEADVPEDAGTIDRIEEEQPSEVKRLLPEEAPRIPCRLLLAEDGSDNQRLISFVLRKAGAEVVVAENGRIAVEKALASRHEQPFDIILMDMQMPVMDGYEATDRLRREGWQGPIIAVTAHAMSGDRERCLDAGCDGFATKPIHRNELIRQIHKHLDASVTRR